MNRPSAAQLEWARRLLAHEGGTGSADAPAKAAVQVYDKLQAHLAPLVGVAGVELLFVRSAKLAGGDFVRISGVSILEGPTRLRETLEAGDPSVSPDSAAVLFGTFLALLATLIGDRLTTQFMRRAWPTIEATAATETRK